MRALAFALALFACAGPVAAGPLDSVPWSGSLVFGIWRSGARIGAHSYAFRQAGDELIVEQHVDFAVRVMSVPLYRYSATRMEVWRGGRIVQYESETNDNGARRRVRGRATESGLAMEGGAGVRNLPLDAVPFGLWNRAALHGAPIFNAEDGTAMALTIKVTEDDFLARYQVTGDVNYLLSYVNSILRGVRIAARDGSTVEYVPE